MQSVRTQQGRVGDPGVSCLGIGPACGIQSSVRLVRSCGWCAVGALRYPLAALFCHYVLGSLRQLAGVELRRHTRVHTPFMLGGSSRAPKLSVSLSATSCDTRAHVSLAQEGLRSFHGLGTPHGPGLPLPCLTSSCGWFWTMVDLFVPWKASSSDCEVGVQQQRSLVSAASRPNLAVTAKGARACPPFSLSATDLVWIVSVIEVLVFNAVPHCCSLLRP